MAINMPSVVYLNSGDTVTVEQPSLGSVTVRQRVNRVTVVQAGGGGGVPYTGAYEVTPTQSTQTLATNGRVMTADVTVNPIPSNYGLITYNGSILTVS